MNGIRAISENCETGEYLPMTASEEITIVKSDATTKTSAKFTIEVGIMWRKEIRRFLENCMFEGADIKYHESKYLTESSFVVKGEADYIQKIYKYLVKLF